MTGFTTLRKYLGCPDCTVSVDGIRFCPMHKSESVEALMAARRANPEVDAIHTFLDRARGSRA